MGCGAKGTKDAGDAGDAAGIAGVAGGCMALTGAAALGRNKAWSTNGTPKANSKGSISPSAIQMLDFRFKRCGSA